MSTTSVQEDRTVAILSYLTLIGFIVALVLHSSKKTDLGRFHLRQSLGLMLTWLGGWFVNFFLAFIPFVGWAAIMVFWLGLLVLWVLGLISAINGQQKPLPVVGAPYARWFGGAFV